MSRLLAFLILYFAFASTAFAGPLGQILIAGLTLIGVPHAAATIIAAVAVTIGSVVLLGTKQVGSEVQADPASYQGEFETDESSIMFAFGRAKIGGVRVFGNTNATNRYRHYVHSEMFKGQACDGYEDYYLGERNVVVDTNDLVNSYPYNRSGVQYVEIKKQLGTGNETLFTGLQTAFPGLISVAHIGYGLAQTLVKFSSGGYGTAVFGAMYQGGEPKLSILARWARVYDPRDVGQDINDGTTWKWSENAVLICAWILMHMKLPDDFVIDWADIGVQATANENGVNHKLAGVFPAENKRRQVMRDALKSAGCEIYTTNVGYSIRIIPDNREPEFEFQQTDIVEIRRTTGPQGFERPNTLVLKYYSPEVGYKNHELTLSGSFWAYKFDEIARVGTKNKIITLGMCPDCIQAQRIGRRLFEEARAPTGTLVLQQIGVLCVGRKVIAFRDNKSNQRIVAEIIQVKELMDEGLWEVDFRISPRLKNFNLERLAPAPLPTDEFAAGTGGGAPATPANAYLVNNQLRVSAIPLYAETEMTFRTYNADDHFSLPLPMTRTGTITGSLDNFYIGYIGADGKFSFRQRGRPSPSNTEHSLWSDYFTKTTLTDNTKPAKPTITMVEVPRDPIDNTVIDFDLSVTTPLELWLAEWRFEYDTNSSPTPPGTWANDLTQTLAFPDFEADFDWIGIARPANGSGDAYLHVRAVTITEDGTESDFSDTFTAVIPEQPA